MYRAKTQNPAVHKTKETWRKMSKLSKQEGPKSNEKHLFIIYVKKQKQMKNPK